MSNQMITTDDKDFFAVDLNSLSDIIDKLSNSAAKLDVNEKQAATNAVRQWERVIKEQIDDKRKDARRIVTSLSGNSSAFNLTDGELEALCRNIGLDKEYDDYMAVRAEIQDKTAAKASADLKYTGINLMAKENAQLRYEHDYEIQTILMEVGKLQNQESRMKYKLVKDIAANPNVQAKLKDAQGYLDRADALFNEATTKAQKVRLNITINDPDVRAALHELLDFQLK